MEATEIQLSGITAPGVPVYARIEDMNEGLELYGRYGQRLEALEKRLGANEALNIEEQI